MNPNIQRLADQFGMKLTRERSSYKDYFWNGKDLALLYAIERYRNERDLEPEVIGYALHSDIQLFHEIAHFVVADPIERTFPEWGCQIGIVTHAYGPEIPRSLSEKEFRIINNERTGVLTQEEQEFREFCADILGTYWCDLFGVNVSDEYRPQLKYINQPLCWKSIEWLWEKGFIPRP